MVKDLYWLSTPICRRNGLRFELGRVDPNTVLIDVQIFAVAFVTHQAFGAFFKLGFQSGDDVLSIVGFFSCLCGIQADDVTVSSTITSLIFSEAGSFELTPSGRTSSYRPRSR